MAIANIVLTDAATPTPINHTFVPIQDGSDARWVNDSGSITLKGQETLGLRIQRSADGVQAHRAFITLWDPTEVTVDGTTSIAYGNSVDLRINFSPLSAEQGRRDLITMLYDLLGEAVVKDAVVKMLPLL